MRGNTSEEPDVCAPVHLSWVITKAKSKEACEGLQFKEIRTFWDTALLIPFMKLRKVNHDAQRDDDSNESS